MKITPNSSYRTPSLFQNILKVPRPGQKQNATMATMTPGRPKPTQSLAAETIRSTNQPQKYLQYVNFLRNATYNSYANNKRNSITNVITLSQNFKLILPL